MSHVYDNWERLVGATLLREELRLTGLRTPSDLSLASSSSFSLSSSSRSLSFPGLPFDYDEILKATNYFNPSNFIMYGRSGDLYDGVLEGGPRIVVKKIDSHRSTRRLDFQEMEYISELELFAKISHPRFVPLIGHCLDHSEAKFLIYKYMPNGDLESSLRRGRISGFKSLDWTTRLKIATGVAEALCYLHHQCDPPLVHGYIQASSILLDDNFEARLGSLGTVFPQQREGKKSIRSRIIRLLPLPKGLKKSASGISDFEDITCAYDVHCFGDLLLELATGMVHGSESFPMLCYADTIDIELVKSIVDPFLILDKDEAQLMEVWATCIIAKACLNLPPSNKPVMQYIFQALQNPTHMVMKEDRSKWSSLATSNSRPSTRGI